MKKIICTALAFMFLGGPAFAHEFILKPVQVGDKWRVEAQAAHVFMVSEEMEPVKDVELFQLGSDAKKSKLKVQEYAINNSLIAELAQQEGSSLLLGHRLPQVWSDTTDDVQAGDRESLEAKGYKVLSVGKYEKFAKALLNASADDQQSYQYLAGDPLEIQLLTNPATIKPGAEVECRILWQGKPFKSKVTASYDGFSKEGDAYAVSTESNQAGIAKFKVENSGLWFIRVGHTATIGLTPSSSSNAPVDKWIVYATYTFEIK